jgi:transcriptional regulator with XRE-family HTH domain
MTKVQQIVSEYRKAQGLSLREFAEQLSAATTQFGPLGFRVTHTSVDNWEKGAFVPDFRELARLAIFVRDWRGEFATDVLAAMIPSQYQPVGEIGKRILATAEQ